MKCPVCDSPNLQQKNSAGKNYPLKKCKNCGLIFDSNPPKQEKAIYEEKYYKSKEIKGGYFNYIAENVINKLTFNERLKDIEKRFKKDAKLLDIGCALGDFLEVARDKQWINSYGVEISDYSIKECRNKGLRVYKRGSDDEKKLLKKDYFDVVVLQDVIEHLKNPKEQIAEIMSILRPGGILFLTTPNIDSLSRILLQKYWYHYKKGEHLIYFNQKNLKYLLSHQGFKEIKVKPTPSWVTVQYLINRMHYYFPQISLQLIDKLFNHLLFKIPFPMYTGEIEAWAIKPK
jgi:2-polyprenyl-3-methyl-5-hydroxy-6-metoxy-1,4-benzoquinol methylase